MTLTTDAACKKAIRCGYTTKRFQGLITLWDRNNQRVLNNATPRAVYEWLDEHESNPQMEGKS